MFVTQINKILFSLFFLIIRNTTLTSDSLSATKKVIDNLTPSDRKNIHETITIIKINGEIIIIGCISILILFVVCKIYKILKKREEGPLLDDIDKYIKAYEDIKSLQKFERNNEAKNFYSKIIKEDKSFEEILTNPYSVDTDYENLYETIYDNLRNKKLIFNDDKYQSIPYGELPPNFKKKIQKLVRKVILTEKNLKESRKIASLFTKSSDMGKFDYDRQIYNEHLEEYKQKIESAKIYKILNINDNISNADLNLIVWGPPGTGKANV
jgi:hypothetical protein